MGLGVSWTHLEADKGDLHLGDKAPEGGLDRADPCARGASGEGLNVGLLPGGLDHLAEGRNRRDVEGHSVVSGVVLQPALVKADLSRETKEGSKGRSQGQNGRLHVHRAHEVGKGGR